MTFTKERLEEIAELARKATYKPCAMHMTNLLAVCDSEVIEEIARQILASMEQEPEGEVVLGDYDDCGDYPDAKVVCIAAQGQADWNNFRNGTKLYAAPQLPQPAPEKIALQNFRAAMEGIGHIRRALEETFGGLHGTHVEPDVLVECKAICDAIYEAYRKPALVTPDGWIPVSERMPYVGKKLALYGRRAKEDCAHYVDEGYLGSNGFFYFFDWEGGPRIDDCHNDDKATVTHWMYWELPAAPHQEVNP